MANRRPSRGRPSRDAHDEQHIQYHDPRTNRGPYQEPLYHPSTNSILLHGGDPPPPNHGAFAPHHTYDYGAPPQGHLPAHVQHAYPQGPPGQFTGTLAVRGYPSQAVQSSYAPHAYPNHYGYGGEMQQPPPTMHGITVAYEYHAPPPAQYPSGAPPHHGSMYHEAPYEQYYRPRSPDFSRQPAHHGHSPRRRSPSPEGYDSRSSEDSYHEESRTAYRSPSPAPTSRAQRSGRASAPSTRRLLPPPPQPTREPRQDQPHPRQTLPSARRPGGHASSSRGGRAASSYQDVRQGDYTNTPRLGAVEAPKATTMPSAQDPKRGSVKAVMPQNQHGQSRRSPVSKASKPVAKQSLPRSTAADESFKRQQEQLNKPAKPHSIPQPAGNAQPLPGPQPLAHAAGATEMQRAIADSRQKTITQDDLDYTGVCGNYGCFENHSPILCDLRDRCSGCDEQTHIRRDCKVKCGQCGHIAHSTEHCKDFAPNGRPRDKYLEKQKKTIATKRLYDVSSWSLGQDKHLYPDEHRSGGPSTRSGAIDPPRSTHESSRGVAPNKGTMPPHLRPVPAAPAVDTKMLAQRPKAEPAKRTKTKDVIRSSKDQHGQATGVQLLTRDEKAKSLQQWNLPNPVLDNDLQQSIRQYKGMCAEAYRYTSNREGPFTFRDPKTRKLTFDPGNGDWELHVQRKLPIGLNVGTTHVSPIFSSEARLDRNIDHRVADEIRQSFPPWVEAYQTWLKEESSGGMATDSATTMARPSEDLIDLSEPAPLPYSESSVSPATDEASNIDAIVPDHRSRMAGLPSSSVSQEAPSDYVDAPESLGLRGLSIGDSISEPPEDDGPYHQPR